MKTHAVTIPEVALVAMTRGMAGAGVGLLVSDYLPATARRAVGWTLVAVGALTTIPIAFALLGKRESSKRIEHDATVTDQSGPVPVI